VSRSGCDLAPNETFSDAESSLPDDEGRPRVYYISMPEILKLAPEVELPRPRSSGVAVVAVAALAMFTAVGASAFIVRVRMGMGPSSLHRAESVLDRAAAARLDLIEAYVAAVGDRDDRTALELYQQIPSDMDPTGHLAFLHDVVVERQMVLLQSEVARGSCDDARQHVMWLRHAAPDNKLSVTFNPSECSDQKRYIRVELAP
jgi:hypothetical protein